MLEIAKQKSKVCLKVTDLVGSTRMPSVLIFLSNVFSAATQFLFAKHRCRNKCSSHRLLLNFNYFLQLIQCGTNSKRIASPFEDVWKDTCSHHRKSALEHLLYLIKEKRNLLAHKNRKITSLSDAKLQAIFNETKLQISRIIKKVRQKANISIKVVNEVKKYLEECIDDIRSKLFTDLDKHRILEFLKKEDIEDVYLAELKDYFMGEMKIFTAPKFSHKSINLTSDLKSLFQTIGNSQVTIICGEAGSGKTSLSK